MNSNTRTTAQGKSERVTVLLPPDLYEQICHDADERLLSRSAVIRETLVERYRPQNGQAPR